MPTRQQYWLFKSEPSAFSIDDLASSADETALWDGVRNYQARNFLRDSVKVGDLVLFYCSREEPLGVAGTMKVVKAGYPDPTQFDPKSKYYDAKSPLETPRWYGVDIQLKKKFPGIVTRDQLASDDQCANMMVMKRGMRLSIQPVTKDEWLAVHQLAGVRP